MAKVLFINASNARLYEDPEGRPKLEPLWAECLAANLPEHEVQLADTNIDGLEALKTQLSNFKPDFVGVSVVTPLIGEANQIIACVRESSPKARVVVGGPHVSALGGGDLDYDFAIRGEGEEVIKQIVDGKITEKQVIIAPRIIDLNALPFPARIAPREKYYLNFGPEGKGQVLASVMTSRSCCHECTYCASKAIFGKGMRFRSAENVAQELKILKEQYGVDSVIFLDDLMTVPKKRFIDLCNLMQQGKLVKRWWMDTACNAVDEGVLMASRDSGCQMIVYGVESGDEGVRKRIKKDWCSLDQVRKAFELSSKLGVPAKANFMIGHLDETEEEIRHTIEFAVELASKWGATRAGFYKVIALPGSELYNITLQRGLLGDIPNFSNFAWYKNPPIISKVSAEKLDQLQKEAYARFTEAVNAKDHETKEA